MRTLAHSLWIGGLLTMGSAVQASDVTHELPAKAPILFSIPLPGGHELPFSNSMVMLFIGVLVLSFIVRLMTKNMTLIPGRFQNVLEAIVEAIYNFVEGMLGPRLTNKYFWFFGTAFLLILFTNYMGLIPGVGIFTITNEAGESVPLFRGANADLNVTCAISFLFAFLWFVWSIREQGLKHFILHIFGPKGDTKGVMTYVIAPLFVMVGFIECISIIIRPIALSARLFGNIYGGESVIEKMSTMSDSPLISAMCVFPFLAMELLVGLVQAFVFLILTVVFFKLQVGDEEEKHTSLSDSTTP